LPQVTFNIRFKNKIMKATTFVNSILYCFFVSASAEKESINPGHVINGRHYDHPKEASAPTVSTEGLNESSEENVTVVGRGIIAGRSDGSTSHYEYPNEDNVNAATNVDPNSRYERPPIPPQVPTETNDVVAEGTSSPSPPNDPEEAPCTTSDGTFGIIRSIDSDSDSDTDNTLMTIPIEYPYEIEAITGTKRSTINNDILPLVEKAIVDSILQEVFPDRCGNTEVGKRRLRIQRRLEVTGVSMYPPDYITTCKYTTTHMSTFFFLPFSRFSSLSLSLTSCLLTCCNFICTISATCNVERSSSTLNECAIVDGELTLFTNDGEAANEQFRIANLIKENMNSGVYDDLSDKIVRLYYLNSSSSDPTESNTRNGEDEVNANGSESATGKSERKSLKVGLFLGLGALVAILAGVVFRTARKMSIINDDQTDMQSGGIQTYLDVDAHRSTSFA
jgi:hypothetical protein